MKNKKYFLIIVGIILIILGGYLYFINKELPTSDFMISLAYILIGCGTGIFGHGVGDIISKILIIKHPEIKKQISIDSKDERNLLILYRAKAKAYDFMTSFYATILLVFVVLQVNVAIIIFLVFSYLLVQGYGMYYIMKYDKEM